jgi:hypothetical protein
LFTSESKYFLILSNSNPLNKQTAFAIIFKCESSSLNNCKVEIFIIKYGNKDNIAIIDSDESKND